MVDVENTLQEDDISQEAVQALNAASQRVRQSGRPMVVVIGRELVRIDATGRKVLKTLRSRSKVTVRKKRAKS